MTRREAAKAYRRIARKLAELEVQACRHISGRDNNQVFEIRFFLKAVAERIEAKYPSENYQRLLK